MSHSTTSRIARDDDDHGRPAERSDNDSLQASLERRNLIGRSIPFDSGPLMRNCRPSSDVVVGSGICRWRFRRTGFADAFRNNVCSWMSEFYEMNGELASLSSVAVLRIQS